MKISNASSHTARGTSFNISEQVLSKANASFEEQLQAPLEPIGVKKIFNDNKIKVQEKSFKN